MGKIFVKGPVESPDDLLAKQTMAQRLQDFKQGVGTASTMAGNFAATRNIKGAARELGTSAGRFANNEIQNFGQFAAALANPVIALLGRKPKTPEEEEYARQMIRIAQQDRIREQMRPARETRAYQELYERYGLSPLDIKQQYGGIDPVEALNQERIVRQGMFRDKRRAELRGEQGGERGQAEQTADEIVTAGRDPMAEITEQGQQLIRNKKIDELNRELLAPLNDEQKGQIQTSVEQLQQNMGEIPKLSHGQSAADQDVLHSEMEKNNQNMDPLPTPGAGVQRGMPKQEGEDEGEGERQMRLMPEGAFGFNKPQQKPPLDLADAVEAQEEGF